MDIEIIIEYASPVQGLSSEENRILRPPLAFRKTKKRKVHFSSTTKVIESRELTLSWLTDKVDELIEEAELLVGVVAAYIGGELSKPVNYSDPAEVAAVKRVFPTNPSMITYQMYLDMLEQLNEIDDEIGKITEKRHGQMVRGATV